MTRTMHHSGAALDALIEYGKLKPGIDNGSSVVRSSAQNGSSNASEFCSLSKPDSARSPLKVAEISL